MLIVPCFRILITPSGGILLVPEPGVWLCPTVRIILLDGSGMFPSCFQGFVNLVLHSLNLLVSRMVNNCSVSPRNLRGMEDNLEVMGEDL